VLACTAYKKMSILFISENRTILVVVGVPPVRMFLVGE
jgi:hypothetical protein